MIQKLREFLDNAHSVYHGVAQLEKQLLSEGYTALKESENWNLKAGGKYYLTKDVNLNSRFAEIKNDDVFLCLNGMTVTARAEGTDGKTNVYRLTGSGDLTICDCNENAGTVTGASMGAIFTMTSATGTVNIYDGIFENNTTNESGAVVVLQNTTQLYIYGGEFKNNTATNNGGVVYVGGNSAATISGGTFTGNSAPKNGGAIYVLSKLDLQGGIFTGNTAGSVTGNNGAGIFFGGTELKISGDPQITGNTVGGAPNNLYLATGKVVTLGELTEIGEYAFYDCALTSVTLPSGLEKIEAYSFYGCKLTEIEIPDSVTEVITSAFEDCTSLTSVTIGNSVTSIGKYAFYNCDSLKTVVFEEGSVCENITSSAFLASSSSIVMFLSSIVVRPFFRFHTEV